MKMAKIAQITARYISSHPVLAEALAGDVVNYSKLARQIAKELDIGSVNAVIAACRRYAEQLRKQKHETGIGILRKSRKTIDVEDSKARITFSVNKKHLAKVMEALGT